MKTIIHVNQHIIKANTKNGTDNPCLIARDYKGTKNGHQIDIIVDNRVVASIMQRSHEPLSCGARCWIETNESVRVIENPIESEDFHAGCIVSY